MSIIACYTTCWPCKFDDHNPQWHSWAGMDERGMPLAEGEVDPFTERCGCYCCAGAGEGK